MSTITEIIDGYRKLLTEDISPKAEARAKICDECEYKTIFNTCKDCKCYLPAKVRATKSKCPKKKW